MWHYENAGGWITFAYGRCGAGANGGVRRTKSMHEIDETAFPPIPPPPPMTAEQRDMAEASIRAAIAREAERHAAQRHAQIMAVGECCAFVPQE